MKAISRRLHRLEERCGLVETGESQRSRELLETLRRRVAARRAREGYQGADIAAGEREDLSGLTVIEILQRGRERARQRTDGIKVPVAIRAPSGFIWTPVLRK